MIRRRTDSCIHYARRHQHIIFVPLERLTEGLSTYPSSNPGGDEPERSNCDAEGQPVSEPVSGAGRGVTPIAGRGVFRVSSCLSRGDGPIGGTVASIVIRSVASMFVHSVASIVVRTAGVRLTAENG